MHRIMSGLAATVLLFSAFAACPTATADGTKDKPAKATPPAITLTNYADGTTIRYPVPLIRGTLADRAATSVEVVNESSQRPTRKMTGLAHKGRFCALAELVPGENRIVVRVGKHQLCLRLTYKPQTNPYVVRVVYLVDKTGATEYQTPLKDDPQDFRGKLDTAMKLMQTFTAERMNDLGLGRATFNLEFDACGKVKVHVLRGGYSIEQFHKMTGLGLWQYAAGQIGRKLPHPKARYLVIPAFTRFDAKTRKVYAHTALGGGAVALFGGGNLFTWPNALPDVQKAFLDARRIDTKRFFSDSVGRHTFWAAASTTIGAALHELGHTFGLMHTRHPHDIMTRGIDRFNRAFTFVDPPHARRRTPYEFKASEVALWAPTSAAWLKFSRWLALDKKDYPRQNRTRITLGRQGKKIRIESETGIGGIVLCAKGIALGHVPIDHSKLSPKWAEVLLAAFGKLLEDDRAAVRVIDLAGHATTVRMKTLLAGPFVRSWRFASVTAPWPDKKSFVPVDAKRLEAIAASAAKARLSTSPAPMVDLAIHFPPAKRAHVAAYAVRTLRCDRPRKVKILAGSDDAIRIWLNGKLVLQNLVLRSAEVDQDSAVVELRKGDNRLVVEVSQGIGGWFLVLRLADPAGGKLLLTPDGRLEKVPHLPDR